MSTSEPIKGHIVISAALEEEVEQLQERLQGKRVVKFVEETFKIEHAKEVMAEAYVSESATKYIIIAAIDFTDVAQNAMLKLLEEPPTNIEFIIISPTKSNLLPTVRSRLPILKTHTTHKEVEIELNFARLDYDGVFRFLKEHARVQKNELKALLEALFYKATVIDGVRLTQRQLDNFEMAYKLVDLNARSQSVLAMILMGFAQERG